MASSTPTAAGTIGDEVLALVESYHKRIGRLRDIVPLVTQFISVLQPVHLTAVLSCIQTDFEFLACYQTFTEIVLDHMSTFPYYDQHYQRTFPFRTHTHAIFLQTLLRRMAKFEKFT